jgi:hypothetical protein
MIGCYIIEPENKEILGISVLKERKYVFVAIERFNSDVVEEYRENIHFPQMEALGIHRKSASF